jgi:4-hydroxybenzoate polyprenyltransferase
MATGCVNEGRDQVNQLLLTRKTPIQQIKLFLALSRTPHGLLDLATPGLAAILCLGALPPAGITLVGFITVFAGYTAVYALNDLVDYHTDKANIAGASLTGSGYLDGIFVRHPLAQGLLSIKEGLLWVLGWATISLLGAYWLNPVCLWIFIAGCFLEAAYCLMLKISHWRTLVAGIIKTLGGLAAVYAVNPHPSPIFLILLFFFIFFWEIGGQNIPADWHDLEADTLGLAKTMPVRYGPQKSSRIIFGSLTIGIILLLPLLLVSPLNFSGWMFLMAIGAGVYLLLIPAAQLCRTRNRSQATAVFNKASYFPLAILVITLFSMAFN